MVRVRTRIRAGFRVGVGVGPKPRTATPTITSATSELHTTKASPCGALGGRSKKSAAVTWLVLGLGVGTIC
jgi:hypothetical protein